MADLACDASLGRQVGEALEANWTKLEPVGNITNAVAAGVLEGSLTRVVPSLANHGRHPWGIYSRRWVVLRVNIARRIQGTDEVYSLSIRVRS